LSNTGSSPLVGACRLSTPAAPFATSMNAGPQIIEPLLLNAGQTAGLLGISRSKLYAMHSAGQLPLPVCIGGCVRWDRAELGAWLSARNPKTGLLPTRRAWLEIQAQMACPGHKGREL